MHPIRQFLYTQTEQEVIVATSYWPIKSINHKNLEGKDNEIFLGMNKKEEQGRLLSQKVMVTLKNETTIKEDYENFCDSIIYYKCKLKTI